MQANKNEVFHFVFILNNQTFNIFLMQKLQLFMILSINIEY